MDTEKDKCSSCKNVFPLSRLNKIRFSSDTILICEFCFPKTDFIRLKNPIDNAEFIDITMGNLL